MSETVPVQVFRPTGEKRVRFIPHEMEALPYAVEVNTGGCTENWVELCRVKDLIEARRVESIIVGAISAEVSVRMRAAKAAYERKRS